MPQKFVLRNLKVNTYYHVFNQGVGEKEIFREKGDYETFLYYLNIYTSSPTENEQKFPNVPDRLKRKNLYSEIRLISYCLMPDHWHLLVKQQSDLALPKLMKQLTNAYTTYFNRKYHREGSLLRGRYRAALVGSEYLLRQMVRFVHLNPVLAGFSFDPRTYNWSSINNHGPSNELLNSFGSVAEWDNFHLDRGSFEASREKIKDLIIEV